MSTATESATITANVIYLKTGSKDFYAFSNKADVGFVPRIHTIAVDNVFYLLLASRFKLKEIRKEAYYRLDVYMEPEQAKLLGERIVSFDPSGTARFFSGNPEFGRTGSMELPEVHCSYITGCYTLTAEIAGRTVTYIDPEGLTSVHIDLEEAKPSHKVMERCEVHLSIRMKERCLNDSVFTQVTDAYHEALKETNSADPADRFDPAVYGTAPGLIVCCLLKSQAANLGKALLACYEKGVGRGLIR